MWKNKILDKTELKKKTLESHSLSATSRTDPTTKIYMREDYHHSSNYVFNPSALKASGVSSSLERSVGRAVGWAIKPC